MYVSRGPSTKSRRGGDQLEGISFDFLKRAAGVGARIIAGGSAAKQAATHVAGEVRKLADKAGRAGAGVQKIAQTGRDAADTIDKAGSAAEGAAKGAVAGAGYGAAGKPSAVMLIGGIAIAIGLGAFLLGRRS